MNFLDPVDVRVVPRIDVMTIEISAADAAYDRVREILVAIQDLTGLPVRFQAEEHAQQLIGLLKEKAMNGDVKIRTDVPIPRTSANNFRVDPKALNIRTQEKLNGLAKEFGQKFEEYGLTCRVFPC